MTYNPSRGVLFCDNSSANAFYEHVFGTLNATNLTAASNVQLHYGYKFEMLPFGNGIVFRGKKTNGDSYLGTISYLPYSFGGATFWTRFVSTIRTFPSTILPSLIDKPKLSNLTLVGSRVYFSAIGDANRGFEPWYYSSSSTPSTIETPQVNTEPLGITNFRDMQGVSYGNYLYYNAEHYNKGSLEYDGSLYYYETIKKTLGNQLSKNYQKFSPTPNITSLKIAGSKIYASSVVSPNNQIYSKDLTNNADDDNITADITSLDNSSAIGNTLYFLSRPRVPGSIINRLWRTDGTAAGTYAIDTENITYTGTYAWNGGVFYAKNNGGGGGGFYRYNHAANVVNTISTGGVFVSQFTEFAGALFYRSSTGSAFGSLRRTDGSTSSNVVVASYAYEDVYLQLVGNRLVIALKSSTTGNWNIRSTIDGTNFTEHFTNIASLTLIGGANNILLGTIGTGISRNLVAYNLGINTSTTMGIGAFNEINIFPAIDDTNPAAPIYYLAMALTSTSGHYLYRTTLTTSGASTLTAIGASWVKVINRQSNPWQTLHRVGRKIFFFGEDTDKSRGIEMWVYNPDRCGNALTLASYDDDDSFIPPPEDEGPKRVIHYLTNTTIQATNKITNATVLYRAGQSITFLPGFRAGVSPAAMFIPAGKGTFEAQIGGCGTIVPR